MTRMKESGIDWIGQIPEEWEISKIKFTTQLNGRIGWQGLTSAEYKEEGPYLITGTDFHNGTINFETAVHIDEKRWLEASQIQVENGDLLITKDGTVGKVAIISGLDDKASLNSGVLRIQTIDEIDRRFLYYVLLSDEFWMWFNYTNSGASTILHLYQNVFDEFTFTFPQKNEQQKIADFLDKKTAQLDKAKALLEEQIQKLKDYRASLIYETVTKGLDKTVPLKDSGIDWIGQVPQGWGVKAIKYIFDEIGSGSTPKSDNEIFYDGDINWIQSGDLYQTDTVTSVSKTISYQGFKSTSALKIYQPPFVALAMYGASVGNVAVSYIDACVNQAVVVMLGASEKVRFGKYAIEASKSNLIFSAQGGTQPNISQNLIKNWSIPQPKNEEQVQIVDFLDKKTVQIDKLIQIKNQQIDNINKQRQTLIYEYVTGKRRV
ncbi:restriction endonuclease subunit S [Streptococcus sp. CF8_St5-17]|uniref:restriction endonuclease subunit S n=1 Tax=Streptococcus sp. CF8_St5-17 TaxID=2963155 RepID=UPI0020C92DBD|nr:restriction endonuclease subunit S [Streptococcus sp. CF8_St5-17]MCP9015950.1 restriction endonuclease subunit S [Streptococcus sp. CF8_St5-17]